MKEMQRQKPVVSAMHSLYLLSLSLSKAVVILYFHLIDIYIDALNRDKKATIVTLQRAIHNSKDVACMNVDLSCKYIRIIKVNRTIEKGRVRLRKGRGFESVWGGGGNGVHSKRHLTISMTCRQTARKFV